MPKKFNFLNKEDFLEDEPVLNEETPVKAEPKPIAAPDIPVEKEKPKQINETDTAKAVAGSQESHERTANQQAITEIHGINNPVTVTDQTEQIEGKRPGRKPKEEKTIRDFLSVNLAGRRPMLKKLCIDRELTTGENVSLNSYILEIIDEHLESKQHILDKYN